MTPRSPELKRVLSSGLKKQANAIPEEAEKEVANLEHFGEPDDIERSQTIKRRLELAREELGEIQATINELSTNVEGMDDQEFDVQYHKLVERAQALQIHINDQQASLERQRREHMQEFVKVDEVESLTDFLDRRAMQWVPTKKEIGKIVEHIFAAHRERIFKREVSREDPIKIVDIGGANGFLAKLIIDMIREQGVKVKCEVVDMDEQTIAAAAAAYADDPDISFMHASSQEYVRKQYEDDSVITELVDKKREVTKKWQKKIHDFKAIEKYVIHKVKAGEMDEAEMRRINELLKTDFNVEIESEELEDLITDRNYEDFKWIFQVQDVIPKDEYAQGELSIFEQVVDQAQAEVKSITQQIEAQLKSRPADHDMVINSWMTPNVDYTADIRALNGAGIFYMISRAGATGAPLDLTTAYKATDPEAESSYNVGENYGSRVIWASTSMSDVKQGYFSMDNGVILQGKNDYAVKRHAMRDGVRVNDQYPWEQELDATQAEKSERIVILDSEQNAVKEITELAYNWRGIGQIGWDY